MVAASTDSPGQGLSGRAISLVPMAMGLGTLLVAFSVGFFSSIQWVIGEWSDSSGVLSHGFLMAAISIYLFARAVPAAAEADRKPFWPALPVLLGLSLLWLLAYSATVVAIQALVLPAILLTAIVATFGLSVARHFAFPVLFIYFAVPAVEHLQFLFQNITVVAVHAMLRIVDLSAYVEGNLVYIPEGTFAVEGGCSGLNFVVSGLSLAALYGYLYHDNVRHTVWLAALVLAVSMIGNWLRVFLIINIGYFDGMDNSMVADHLWLGWVIFAILMVPVFFVARRFESASPGATGGRPDRSVSDQAMGGAPVVAILMTLGAMVAGPAFAKVTAPAAIDGQNLVVGLPESIDGWYGPVVTAWEWQPQFVGSTAERVAEYRQGETTILVYSSIYLTQVQGSELVYFMNSILGDWRRGTGDVKNGEIDIPGSGSFQRVTAVTPYGQWIIVHRNIIDGEPVIGNIQSKIRQSIATLRGRPEAGVVAFAIPCRRSCSDASGELEDFVSLVAEDATISYQIKGR